MGTQIQLSRSVRLAATGGPGAIVTIDFEVGQPYKNLSVFLNGSAVNVDVQPVFGGKDEGLATNVSSEIHQKIFQTPGGEVRPATTGIKTHPADQTAALPLKSSIRLTNNDAAAAVIGLYFTAETSFGA